jgi:hypothetical protein
MSAGLGIGVFPPDGDTPWTAEHLARPLGVAAQSQRKTKKPQDPVKGLELEDD